MQTYNFYTDPAHVPLDQLRRYQADALPLAERHQVEKHLLGCDLCSDLLEGLEASPAPITQRAVQEINHRLAASLARQRNTVPFYAEVKNWGVAAAILIFILSGAVVVYYNLQNIKSAENAATLKASAPPPVPTIIKPTQPALTENKPALPVADSNRNNPVLAYKKPKLTGSSSGQQNQIAIAPSPKSYSLTEVVIPNPDPATPQTVSSVAAPVLDSDTPAVAIAPQPDVTKALSGRAAGVAVTKARNSFLENKSKILDDNAIVLGRVVKGKVSDESGQGLPGVTVSIKGTNLGAVTDATGAYNLVLPEGRSEATLVFSFIGFTTTEKKINNLSAQLALNVALAADAKALSEVVVVGYGTQARTEVTETIKHAKPKTGFKAFRKYIEENLKYPAAEKKVKGRVVVGFTVNPDGTLSDFNIIKSLSPECNAEALRLLRAGPIWEPATKSKVAVPEQVRIAIRFKPTK